MSPSLIDSSIWIDFTRTRSPRALKEFLHPYVVTPEALLAEPIVFEVLKYADEKEVRLLTGHFSTIPVLHTPNDVWEVAAGLGRQCRKQGLAIGSLDLLIAAVALYHEVAVITLDGDFQNIAKACKLQVVLLKRPAP